VAEDGLELAGVPEREGATVAAGAPDSTLPPPDELAATRRRLTSKAVL
jgi:hypothetical protein